MRFSQDFLWYKGTEGDNTNFKSRASGAYIFRPNGTAERVTKQIQYEIHEGPLVTEIHQIFNKYISQIVKIYTDRMYVEFDWLVGPIPIE